MDEQITQEQVLEKTPKKLDPRLLYYLRIIGTLFVITTIVAVLLALVNLFTKPVIDANAEKKRQTALAEVMPDAQYETITQLPDGVDGLVAMTRATQGSVNKGYCVQVTTNGFGGAMELMVGVDTDGAITGVSILSHSETLNTNLHGWLVAQYPGRSGVIGVSKSASDATHIQAISGATVTSNGVTRGVNNALEAVDAYEKGGIS